MRAYLILLSTIICVSGAPFTFSIGSNAQECFYILTPDIDSVVSYYFAVQHSDDNKLVVDYEIFAPDNKYKPIIKREREAQGEWTFVGEHKGEYAFCFKSDGASKVVDLEIKSKSGLEDRRLKAVEKRKKARNRHRFDTSDELQQSIENSVDLIERQLNILGKNMQYYKTRNSRNQHTVASTEKRIVWFSLYGILLVVAMGLAQIFILQMFFNESRKHVV